MPIQKTLTLVNNFILNTASFLNTFTETVENKILSTSNKITQLEILLSVLEAKLNSIPGLESSLPAPESTSIPSSSTTTATPSAVVSVAPETSAEPQSSTENANDGIDEAYSPFLKMIKVGIPKFVAQAKAAAAGLDPSVLENYNP